MPMHTQSGRGPTLSIVVPVTHDTAALEATLVSVLENRPAHCEVVVPLACEYADPWNIRDEVRFVPAPPGSSLVTCVNLGIASSVGPVVHVLAAGWLATDGWADAALARFEREDVAAVVPLVVAPEARDRVESAGLRCRAGGRRAAAVPRGLPLAALASRRGPSPEAPVLEAGFWRADVLRAAGPGFATACGEALADADMVPVIAALGMTSAFEPGSLVIAGQNRASSGPFAAGLHAERLFWRSVASRRLLPALAAHGIEVLRHAAARAPLGTVPMLLGRLIALLQFGSFHARYRQLRALRQAADGGDTANTLRFDPAHERASEPRKRGHSAPMRRSA